MEEDAKGKMVQLKLKEKLKEHSKKLQDHDESLKNMDAALNSLGKVLKSHDARFSQLERSISQKERTQPEQFNSKHDHEPHMLSRGVPIHVNGALPLAASVGAASVESSGAKPKGARAFPSGASAPDEARVVVLPGASPRYWASTSSPKHSTPRPFTTGASTSRVPKADEASVGAFSGVRAASARGAVASSPRPLTSREGRDAQSYSGYGYESLRSGDCYNLSPKSINGNQVLQPTACASITAIDTFSRNHQEIIQPGSTKQVLLLHSSDSQERLSVVFHLKMFLNMHGFCNVVLLSDYNRSMRFHEWLAIQMRDAHKILVIFSEGAKKWPVDKPSLDDDKFLTALSICLSDFECNNNKYVISHFDYSNESDVILQMRVGVYNLMRDLDKVIFRIHNFCPSGPQFRLQAPQLTFETYATASGEGCHLSQAIQEASRRRDYDEFDRQSLQLCTIEDDDDDAYQKNARKNAMKSFFSLNNE